MPLLTDTASTRAYLSRELASISDADPNILADYILALLRHDKPVDEMRRVCLENLQDFLHDRTGQFVERLFVYLLRGEGDAASLANTPVPHSQPQQTFQEQLDRDGRSREDRSSHRHDRRREMERELSPESRHRRSLPSGRPSSRYRSHPFPPPPMPFGIPPPFGMQTDQGIHLPRPSHRGRHNISSTNDTRLVVDRIPFEHCSMSSVSSFFSKFGNLVNVTVNPDQRRARIQFATGEEASQAYHSADAIFDNRFVKLYWDREGEGIPAPQASRSLEVVRDASMPLNPPTLASTISIAAARRQEALKTMLSLQKQQQELLTRYIDQQKTLMSRLESGSVSDTDKTALMDSLRNVDSLIISMRESMQSVETKLTEMTSQGSAAAGESIPKPEYKSPVLRGGPANRAPASRGRSRTAAQSYKLDMRPKCLLLKPVPVRVGRDIDSVRKLFEPFGSIKSIKVVDGSNGADNVGALVEFGQRHEAEQAMFYMSKSDLGEPFELQWIQQPASQSTPSQMPTMIDVDVNMSDGAVEGEQVQVAGESMHASLQVENENR